MILCHTLNVTATLLIISLPALSEAPSPECDEGRKHSLFLLAGAPAIYAGVSYEFLAQESGRIKLLPRGGAGLNIFRPSLGKEFDLHAGITFLYGHPHAFEAGMGTLHYFLHQSETADGVSKTQYRFGIYWLAGYRYSFNKAPLSLKVAVTPVLFFNPDRPVLFPLAEIGAGINF